MSEIKEYSIPVDLEKLMVRAEILRDEFWHGVFEIYPNLKGKKIEYIAQEKLIKEKINE